MTRNASLLLVRGCASGCSIYSPYECIVALLSMMRTPHEYFVVDRAPWMNDHAHSPEFSAHSVSQLKSLCMNPLVLIPISCFAQNDFDPHWQLMLHTLAAEYCSITPCYPITHLPLCKRFLLDPWNLSAPIPSTFPPRSARTYLCSNSCPLRMTMLATIDTTRRCGVTFTPLRHRDWVSACQVLGCDLNGASLIQSYIRFGIKLFIVK